MKRKSKKLIRVHITNFVFLRNLIPSSSRGCRIISPKIKRINYLKSSGTSNFDNFNELKMKTMNHTNVHDRSILFCKKCMLKNGRIQFRGHNSLEKRQHFKEVKNFWERHNLKNCHKPLEKTQSFMKVTVILQSHNPSFHVHTFKSQQSPTWIGNDYCKKNNMKTLCDWLAYVPTIVVEPQEWLDFL